MIARRRHALVAALSAAALLPSPAQAQEAAGGVVAPTPAPVAQAVTASGGGVSLTARPDATVGQLATVRGSAAPSAAGRRVKLQLQDPKTLAWSAVAKTKVGRDGTFAARWRPQHIGRFALRTVLTGASPALDVDRLPRVRRHLVRPRLLGQPDGLRASCSRPMLMGVAHRTLPCGTLVQIDYQGRSLILPVVDRGPYGVAGADWDLTQARGAFALGIGVTSAVGALRMP